MSFQFDCYLVVPDAARSRVLLVQDECGYKLPHFAFAEDHFGIVDHISRAAWERLGLSLRSFVAFPTTASLTVSRPFT